MDNPLTLQEAKDQVARDVYGHPDWNTFRADGLDWRVYRDAADEVAEVYAKAKWNESARAVLMSMNGWVYEGDIPEFKP